MIILGVLVILVFEFDFCLYLFWCACGLRVACFLWFVALLFAFCGLLIWFVVLFVLKGSCKRFSILLSWCFIFGICAGMIVCLTLWVILFEFCGRLHKLVLFVGTLVLLVVLFVLFCGF